MTDADRAKLLEALIDKLQFVADHSDSVIAREVCAHSKSEFHALAEENDGLRAEVERLKSANEHWHTRVIALQSDYDGYVAKLAQAERREKGLKGLVKRTLDAADLSVVHFVKGESLKRIMVADTWIDEARQALAANTPEEPADG